MGTDTTHTASILRPPTVRLVGGTRRVSPHTRVRMFRPQRGSRLAPTDAHEQHRERHRFTYGVDRIASHGRRLCTCKHQVSAATFLFCVCVCVGQSVLYHKPDSKVSFFFFLRAIMERMRCISRRLLRASTRRSNAGGESRRGANRDAPAVHAALGFLLISRRGCVDGGSTIAACQGALFIRPAVVVAACVCPRSCAEDGRVVERVLHLDALAPELAREQHART